MRHMASLGADKLTSMHIVLFSMFFDSDDIMLWTEINSYDTKNK